MNADIQNGKTSQKHCWTSVGVGQGKSGDLPGSRVCESRKDDVRRNFSRRICLRKQNRNARTQEKFAWQKHIGDEIAGPRAIKTSSFESFLHLNEEGNVFVARKIKVQCCESYCGLKCNRASINSGRDGRSK